MAVYKEKWTERPTIINTIPQSKDKMIMFIDESGEGNVKKMQKAYKEKLSGAPFSQRNDLYILNGVVLNGVDNIYLSKLMDDIRVKIKPNGLFDYEKKGIRPVLLRNHDLSSKNPPFNNLADDIYVDINNMIKKARYKIISAGLNYYTYSESRSTPPDEWNSPLLMALGLLLVNYARYLNKVHKKGIIIFEEETRKHDEMKLRYILKVLKCGNKTQSKKFFSNITGVYFRKKWTKENDKMYVTTPGIELADLTISPLRRILHTEFLIIERKLLNYPDYVKNGFTIIT